MDLPDNRGLKSFFSEFPPSPPKQETNPEDEANNLPAPQAGKESETGKERKPNTKGSPR